MGLLSLISSISGGLTKVGQGATKMGIPLAERLLSNTARRGAIIGAAYLGNKAVQGFASHTEGLMRGYYGDKEYESRYQAGLDTVSGVSSALAGYVGITQALNVSPIRAVGRGFANVGRAAKAGVGKMVSRSSFARGPRVRGRLAGREATRAGFETAAAKSRSIAGRFGIREERARANLVSSSGMVSGDSARALIKAKKGKALYTRRATEAGSRAAGVSRHGSIRFAPGKTTIKDHDWLMHAAMPLGIAAGLAVGSSIKLPRSRATPEGNITGIGSSSDITEKLNFSTAGLVQALHSSRRRLD